ncbi:MAG: PD40 domain-containing protein [Planctomycetes bacterium]|nr:PD40 domain-containing protein [Planctomycetota bacterium]
MNANVALLRDRQAGTTECVSVDASGVPKAASTNLGMWVSSDARFVAFGAEATDLVPGDTNAVADIFLRDRRHATTERVSVGPGGTQANGVSVAPTVSDDGRCVAFLSSASNLVVGDTNGTFDVFVRDRETGSTQRVNVSSFGAQGNGASNSPAITRDGRYVAFTSAASNLVQGDTNGHWDAFVRDRQMGTTVLVTVASDGTQGDGDSDQPALSDDGRFVAFTSLSANLVAGDSNGYADVFVHDLVLGTTERVSLGQSGVEGDFFSSDPDISGDGRFVAFRSQASNLLGAGVPTFGGVFVYDRLTHALEIVDTPTVGGTANAYPITTSISRDGRYVAFGSEASDLVPGDTNSSGDVFIHDRHASGFTGICDPGTNNVLPCPCNNPPSGPGQGCDNSSFTGGAILAAQGYAYVSIDSLVFTTLLEKPSALSILLQGSGVAVNGVAFGQGVRCAGGVLKRLYVKQAANGSITAPELGAGDATVSARCAQLGIPIQSGQAHIYQVYYRDSAVLGGCPAASTFNATQAGSVSWWP